ncbi:MAG TPA: YecA family protein, partial [Cellvibrionaceae bacterium]
MNMLDAKPLTSAEARKLNQFLQLPHMPPETLNLTGLKGYLFAVCTTPALLQPSAWLPGIFGSDMPELQADEAENFGHIIQLYNQINDDVIAGSPKLPPGCKLAKTPEDNFKPGHPLHDWAEGFSRAMSLFDHHWEELVKPGTESFDMLIEYWGLFGFFSLDNMAE